MLVYTVNWEEKKRRRWTLNYNRLRNPCSVLLWTELNKPEFYRNLFSFRRFNGGSIHSIGPARGVMRWLYCQILETRHSFHYKFWNSGAFSPLEDVLPFDSIDWLALSFSLFTDLFIAVSFVCIQHKVTSATWPRQFRRLVGMVGLDISWLVSRRRRTIKVDMILPWVCSSSSSRVILLWKRAFHLIS